MALRYGYFDSEIIGIDDEGMPVFDRAETSDLFALLLASLVSDGVLAQPKNCLQVLAAGNGLGIEIQPGFGMVRGHFVYNDEKMKLDIGVVPQRYSRIDRVVLRCNYLDRMVEIVIKNGIEAANPVPPELTRPTAGDYYELCLANISLKAKQSTITQSSIMDTRPNSAVCGYITQLIDHLDTAVFFAQFDAFYKEFVDRAELTYETFEQMTEKAYLYFSENLNDYIKTLKEKGDSDLAAITQHLTDFKDKNEADFLKWFEHIKEIFKSDPVGSLAVSIEEVTERVEDIEEMLFTGMVKARLKTEDGDYITDELGNSILTEWPICKCNK